MHASLEEWLTGPKSPGLIILEHELSNMSVQAFIDAFPLIGQNGWNIVSVTELGGADPYQNANSSTSSVQPANGILAFDYSASANISSSTVSPQISSESGFSSQTPSATTTSSTTTSSTTLPSTSSLGAQEQQTSSSTRNEIAPWRMVEFIALAVAVVLPGASII